MNIDQKMFCKFCDGYSVFIRSLQAAINCSMNGPQETTPRLSVKHDNPRGKL